MENIFPTFRHAPLLYDYFEALRYDPRKKILFFLIQFLELEVRGIFFIYFQEKKNNLPPRGDKNTFLKTQPLKQISLPSLHP